MTHQCIVVGTLLIFFALLGTLALFSRDEAQQAPSQRSKRGRLLNGN